ncbi:MAG: TonB-dependent receptor plug domain-containing protein, partial [Bacteroidota bacterium]|nr:TonB-dependent receptor plug domain-containing protein [Bacteroidota bacterium]
MSNKIAPLQYVVVTTLFLLFSFLSFAQNSFKVNGKIKDNAGQPLEGVTVQEKGTANRTLSKSDGSFSLSVASGNAILVLSSVGFTQKEFPVNNTSDFNASLTAASNSLEDVVVIGYATVKRKDVTGAVAGINQKDIRSRPVDNALQAMQGKVSGVDITSNERPGQIGSINIRGVRSLTASNSPLFVVDGIPLSTGGIEYLNPNDIESIDVLKDASATAIFGS